MATKRIFMGNIPFNCTEEEIKLFFDPFKVLKSRIITDRETGRSRGFAFIELVDSREVDKAIENLNGAELMGRKINLNIARERDPQEVRKSAESRGGNNRRRDDGRDDFNGTWK